MPIIAPKPYNTKYARVINSADLTCLSSKKISLMWWNFCSTIALSGRMILFKSCFKALKIIPRRSILIPPVVEQTPPPKAMAQMIATRARSPHSLIN